MATILIIDDEEPLRFLIRVWLIDAGHQVIEAATGKEGVKLFELHAIDLVVTDLFMPDMDGLEVLREVRLKPRGKSCPILVTSGSSDNIPQELLTIASHLGAATVLAKPFAREELVGIVNVLLKG